jgi:hypothetical protein
VHNFGSVHASSGFIPSLFTLARYLRGFENKTIVAIVNRRSEEHDQVYILFSLVTFHYSSVITNVHTIVRVLNVD